ncbi:39S ribosomal protein L37, mitochondrial [Oryzias melastigma]|uniref:Large ribosomal subunit protein mL37 n=1 Tax=Oryzias melastigma TaxID=30732 RepID=A0A3B3BB80_ORYME|nr:39S ribosomal protein L37, mitochondrial [Oryzias melastigma]KAF6720361.1 39S ribosomal protein L37, mitochondrial [Oryzias melastigma]
MAGGKIFLREARCLQMAASLYSRRGGLLLLQTRRHLAKTCPSAAKIAPPRRPREKVEIPGLEVITYGERMHYVPGLAKPVYPPWERDYKDPGHCKSPPAHEMALFKEKPCYIFNQRTSLLEGVRQAAWLTKSQVNSGLPPKLLTLAESLESQAEDQSERVQNAIKHARFWDTTESRPNKRKYSKTLLLNLLHLCETLQSSSSAQRRRIFAENYSLSAMWRRGEDLFQVRGQNGLLQCSMDALPQVSEEKEISSTVDHVLETFYPVSPTIDLQKADVYKEENCTGFRDDYLYPHAHTLYFLEATDPQWKLKPEQFRAKMLMFAFGNALARAHKLYGTEPLQRPITVQSVGTNGRVFEFLVFQLNTTDLVQDDGIKNQVWLDAGVALYDFAKVRPLIKKKEVTVPAGLSGYKPETFRKFLALYLHGSV